MSDDHLKDIPTLGRSVEDVRRESGNRVNPSDPEETTEPERHGYTPNNQVNLTPWLPAVGAPAATALNATEGADERDNDDFAEGDRSD